MSFRVALASLACAAAVGTASGQYYYDDAPYQSGQWYIAGTANGGFDRDLKANKNIATGEQSAFSTAFDPEWSPLAAVGYHVGPFRGEIEGGYRQLEVDGWKNIGADATGDVEFTSFMINVYYDHPIIKRRLDAYVGGGFGLTYVDANLDFSGPVTVEGSPTPVSGVDDNVWSTSFQVMAGLTLHLTDNIALTGGYRGFYVDTNEFGNDVYFDDTFFHGVDLGLRITF